MVNNNVIFHILHYNVSLLFDIKPKTKKNSPAILYICTFQNIFYRKKLLQY